MGVAVGCIGLSLSDFCALTPSEFSATHQKWLEAQDLRERRAWERTRMLATCAVQPYSKKKLKTTDLMVFPWDRHQEEAKAPAAKSTEDRFRELVNKFCK